jgi:exodeoxyribonuclease VII large subunit
VVALTPNGRELMVGLLDLHKRLFEAVEHRLELARRHVEQLAARPALRRPLQRIRDLEQRLDDAAGRLNRAANQRTIQAREKLAALASRLETLSPLNVLTRGYSLTHTDDGRLLRATTQVEVGDRLVTRLAEGEVVSRVESTRPMN